MLIRQGRYYRLTDVWQKKEYAAWEYCRPDESEALVTVITMDTQCNPATEYVKLRGLGEDKNTGWRLLECRPVAKMGSGSMAHRMRLSRSILRGHSLYMLVCRFRGLGTSISRGRYILRKCKGNIWKGGCRRCCEGKLSEAGACFVPMSENKKS